MYNRSNLSTFNAKKLKFICFLYPDLLVRDRVEPVSCPGVELGVKCITGQSLH